MVDLFLWACLLVFMACSGIVVKTGLYIIYKATVPRCVNGKAEELGKWSQTTTRHQKEFRKQFER